MAVEFPTATTLAKGMESWNDLSWPVGKDTKVSDPGKKYLIAVDLTVLFYETYLTLETNSRQTQTRTQYSNSHAWKPFSAILASFLSHLVVDRKLKCYIKEKRNEDRSSQA